jgi:hypothetical protein
MSNIVNLLDVRYQKATERNRDIYRDFMKNQYPFLTDEYRQSIDNLISVWEESEMLNSNAMEVCDHFLKGFIYIDSADEKLADIFEKWDKLLNNYDEINYSDDAVVKAHKKSVKGLEDYRESVYWLSNARVQSNKDHFEMATYYLDKMKADSVGCNVANR